MKRNLPSLLRAISILIFLALTIPSTYLAGQSIISVQGQAGFVMSTKTGEIYSVNASTGTAKLITTAPLGIAINSLATDTGRGIIYYCYNDYISTNRSVYGYNYITNTHFTLINNFTTAPGSPVIALGGIGTAGAAFYNGYLYLGVEMARSLSPAVPNIGGNVPYGDRIYKLTLNAAGTAITATSLVKDFYTDNGYIQYNSTSMGNTVFSFYQYDHNWGDFVIINDTIFDRSVRGYTSGSFMFEQTTRAFTLSSPALPAFNTLTLPATTILNDGFSYVQTASDGFNNLIFVGNEGNANQYFVIADKTNGSYNIANTKLLTVNGAPFAKAVTDCGNVIKGVGTIGNKVWYDADEDGFKDAAETGLANVPVELWEDLNSNGVVDEATDKLLGTAITAYDGSYQFVNMMQGNYLVRCIRTLSVNYPAQAFSATYPINPLVGSSRLIKAGDETIAGSNSINLISKSFSALNFNDQTNDFGFAGNLGVLALNNYNLKGTYANHAVKLNWELWINEEETEYAVERSIDGHFYNSIITGTIIPAGTKVLTTNFDLNLPAGATYLYYRLKLTGKNGKVERSNTVLVKTSNEVSEQVVVFPNPAKNKTRIYLPQSMINKPVLISFINSSGQVYRKLRIDNPGNAEEIDITGLKQGIYFLMITSDNNSKAVFTGKLEIL
jgi:hypothetical protein